MDENQNLRNLVSAVVLQAIDDFINLPGSDPEHKAAKEFLMDDQVWINLGMRCRGRSIVKRLILTNRKNMRRTLDRGWRSYYELD